MPAPKWIWPTTENFYESRQAAGLGAGTAIFCGIVTGVVTWFATHGKSLLPGIDATSYIDAGIFLIIGFFIMRMSRIAAVAGLLVYVWGQYEMMKTNGGHMNYFLVFMFTMNFINGIRGTFAWHEFNRHAEPGAEKEEEAARKAALEESGEAPALRKRQRIALAVLGVCVVIGGGFWLTGQIKSGTFNKQPQQVQAVKSDKTFVPIANAAPVPAAAPAAPAVPQPGAKTFRLKNGEVISGKVLIDDSVFYEVETSDGQHKTIIKEDLASAS